MYKQMYDAQVQIYKNITNKGKLIKLKIIYATYTNKYQINKKIIMLP